MAALALAMSAPLAIAVLVVHPARSYAEAGAPPPQPVTCDDEAFAPCAGRDAGGACALGASPGVCHVESCVADGGASEVRRACFRAPACPEADECATREDGAACRRGGACVPVSCADGTGARVVRVCREPPADPSATAASDASVPSAVDAGPAPPVTGGGGCSSAGSAAGGSSFIALGVALLAGAFVKRRRRGRPH